MSKTFEIKSSTFRGAQFIVVLEEDKCNLETLKQKIEETVTDIMGSPQKIKTLLWNSQIMTSEIMETACKSSDKRVLYILERPMKDPVEKINKITSTLMTYDADLRRKLDDFNTGYNELASYLKHFVITDLDNIKKEISSRASSGVSGSVGGARKKHSKKSSKTNKSKRKSKTNKSKRSVSKKTRTIKK